MKHIVINNFGPLTKADVHLRKINVEVGPQSSGKSCLLKIASFCAWVEKSIQRSQDYIRFEVDGAFEKYLSGFHKLEGYARADSFISYENDTMKFCYNFQRKKFSFNWKENKHWAYKSVKVSYIPAERNVVSVIPNWFEVSLKGDNLQSFMSDWHDARSRQPKGVDILNLGVRYHYDSATERDYVTLKDGGELPLTNTSSGLQSLIPLYVHLNYLYYARFRIKTDIAWGKQKDNKKIKDTLYEQFYLSPNGAYEATIDGDSFCFADEKTAKKFEKHYNTFTKNLYNDVFLEEPEVNLFPPTQCVLMNHLIDFAKGSHADCLFIATHSPYIVTSLVEHKDLDLKSFGLFFTKSEGNGKYSVVTASEDDIQTIYEFGADVFFNLESFTDGKL